MLYGILTSSSLLHIFGGLSTYLFPKFPCHHFFPQEAPRDSDGKESACNVADLGLIPGSGRSLREGNGNPLWCSCLRNPVDREAWWSTVHGVTESDMTEQLTETHFFPNHIVFKSLTIQPNHWPNPTNGIYGIFGLFSF